MATQEFNSLPESGLSTISSGARALDGEQRLKLAVQALSRTESLTKLAERHGVSRKFIYHQAEKGTQALKDVFQSPSLDDDEVLFYLPVTRAWLRQVVLGLVLLCHSSFRGVIAFFRDLLDHPIALGTVHNIVQQAVVEARRINASENLSGVRAGSHDELFQGHKPVLAGIDLDSLYCYLLATEAHRDGETWAVHLLDLTQKGLKPDYVVADGGTGLRAGQALAWPEVACDGDVFHGLQTVTRLATTLERRAYAAITQSEQIEKKMNKAKRKKRGRSLSKKLARTRAAEAISIHLTDTVQILSTWLREDILSLAGPDAPTRRMLYDFVVDSLHELEVLDRQRLRPVRRALANQRDTLLAFVSRLDQELEGLAKQFSVPTVLVREMLTLTSLSSTSSAYSIRLTALQKKLHGSFPPLKQALEEQCKQFHRASSLVENFNSRLRNYFFLRRQVGPAYLDLLRFFLNHQPFARSERPERRGKSPAELLTGQSHPHWLEMLGFTRFQRVHATA